MMIVDRRPNPQGKSLPNRQRFLNRAREEVRKAVAESIDRRRVADGKSDEEVKVRVKGTVEPSFRRAAGGDQDHVLPGNGSFNRGDRLRKPEGAEGGGNGDQGGSGEGEDGFEFTLTRQEFLDYFFEEMELPRLVRNQLGATHMSKPRRAGFAVSGQPTALDIRRTMRNSLGRRIAMKRPHREDIERLQHEVAAAVLENDTDRLRVARAELELALRHTARIPYVDPIDLRYARHARVPEPAVEAVMFCLMDVSGSMTEHMKSLAKRFFMLLHLFLERKYTRVHIVFIRHTETAQEVDEEVFFRSRETGGTVVSSALKEMLRVQEERFPPEAFNIYVAQASDGDNSFSDQSEVTKLMESRILPIVRYFAYVETGRGPSDRFMLPTPSGGTSLWLSYRNLAQSGRAPQLVQRKLADPADVWNVFAELFRKSDRSAA